MSYYVHDHSDSVVICPYDSNHKIARSRIQGHLVKCEKVGISMFRTRYLSGSRKFLFMCGMFQNFPPDYKQQCPYDATHRLFEYEMIDHVENCPMKFMFENGGTYKIIL